MLSNGGYVPKRSTQYFDIYDVSDRFETGTQYDPADEAPEGKPACSTCSEDATQTMSLIFLAQGEAAQMVVLLKPSIAPAILAPRRLRSPKESVISIALSILTNLA